MYELKQAPKIFFEKLRAGLVQWDFIPSKFDPCLFMKKDLLCIVYVDDTLNCETDSESIDKKTLGLGVSVDKQCQKC